jgi:phosphocarrier protein HPr
VIANEAGIHVRPSGVIYSAVRGYAGTVVVRHGSEEAEIGSVMRLIALGLVCGDEIEIEVTGPDEDSKLAEVRELFECRFDFPPRS